MSASPPQQSAITSTRLIVGMEIHVELATRSKMFSAAANLAHPDHFEAEPNTLIDPVVLALPGALPVMNKQAIEMSMMIGLALNCTIAEYSKWDRKNYFYPDLPKGYQISQYDLPLCADGYIEIVGADGKSSRIRILRAHLEEDAGKLGHELPGGGTIDGSLVDYNRAGTPLLEIVTEPDLTSADDAVIFCRELRNICRFLGVTEANMQRGHMRFEPNINVAIYTDDGHEYKTPIVEIKNLNSFRAVKAAIEHEHERQIAQWQSDGQTHGMGMKSTRGWDDQRAVTFLQRSKEDAHDYRYFPEPDLVPVVVDDEWRDEVAQRIPELPMQRRARYVEHFGLSDADAWTLTAEREISAYYEACIEAYHELTGSGAGGVHAGREIAKLLTNIGARLANERGCDVDALGITPGGVAGIVQLRDDDAIGSSAADRLYEAMCEMDNDAHEVAEQLGLLQVRDESQLDAWIEQAIKQQPQAAADFANGKDAALGRLTGAVMKASKGQADARAVQDKLRVKLRE